MYVVGRYAGVLKKVLPGAPLPTTHQPHAMSTGLPRPLLYLMTSTFKHRSDSLLVVSRIPTIMYPHVVDHEDRVLGVT